MARSLAPALALIALGALPFAACSGGSGGGGGGGSTAAASGGGSTAGGTTSSGTGAGAPAPTQPPSGMWLKGDLHVHSSHSDDTGRFGNDVRALIGLAEVAGLDFLMIGDHRQTTILNDPLLQTPSQVIVIPGMEWGGGGHAGAHGLTRQPPYLTQTGATAAEKLQSIHDSIADVHAQGGIFVLNHPVDPRNLFGYPVQGMDGIEIWNGLWALRAQADSTAQDVRDFEQHGNFAASGIQAPPELFHAVSHMGGGKNYQALKMWEAHLDAGRHLAAVGGGDHHYLVLPGMPTTVVFASAATPQGVLEGIRNARTMVTRGPDAPLVQFEADRDGDGIYESIIGDSIPLGNTVHFRVRVVDAIGGKVDVVRDGQVVHSFPVSAFDETFTWTEAPSARSWVRVDVYERLDMSFPQASNLKLMVMGVQGQSWVSALSGMGGFLSGITGWLSGMLGEVQDIVETGAPAAVWLLVFGQQMGVSFAPTPTVYPTIQWPEEVSRILNVDLLDDDFGRAAITSPIWIE